MTRTKKQTLAKSPSPATIPISAHLAELRTRLGVVFLFFVIAASLAYAVRDPLVAIVLAPIGSEKLIYLTPGGGFTFIFQIAIYAAILVTAPLATYELYKFIAPALSHSTRKGTFWLIISATLLMVMGACFGYFVAIPGALNFLTNFADGYVTSSLTADSYLNFAAAYILGLGLMFQLPLLLILWNRIFPINPGGLWKSQRFVIVGAFIAAAFITPTPDGVNQTLIALPIILVYQLGVIAVWRINRKTRRMTAATSAPASAGVAEPVGTVPQPTPIHQPQPSANQRATELIRQLPAPRSAATTINKVPRRRNVSVDGFAPQRRPIPSTLNTPTRTALQPRRNIDGILSY